MSNNNSNNKNTPSPDATQKKRKMGQNAKNSRRALSPDTAAKFIQQAKSRKDVKITFGPSRPPPNNNRSVNFGAMDLEALKETAAAAAATKPRSSKGGRKNKDGLPCSEAEMKALMSMFVEIMGMSMDSDKVQAPRNNTDNKKGPVLMFGNSNGVPIPPGGWSEASAETMAAATAGFFADGGSWEALRRTYGAVNGAYDDDYDDDDSTPDLDEMRDMFKAQQRSHIEAMKKAGDISPSEWESIEQVAMDNAMEAEDRARKASKKREKRQRKKERQKEEAAQKAAEAAQKKREKAILSWRSRVVSACQANEVTKLDTLLQESPLRKTPDEETISRSFILPHLEFLLPNSIAKNISQLDRGKEARKRLVEYLLSSDVPLVFKPLRSGRTALHSACFHGDIQFLRLALDRVGTYEDTESQIPKSCMNLRCSDSGWSPLHYAAVSGSKEVLETLLAAGCDTSTITDDTHTWRERDGKGITPRELVHYITREEHEKVIETHGVALQEMTNTFFSHHTERRAFLRNLELVLERLTDVETNGYSPPKQNAAPSAKNEESEGTGTEQEQRESASTRKRKKKKKKKQTQKAEYAGSKPTEVKADKIQQMPVAQAKKAEKDALVVALLGIGFVEEQIIAAVKACGGTNRATADDLVTWILGQDADGNIKGTEDDEADATNETQRRDVVESTPETVSKPAILPEEVMKSQVAAEEEAAAAQRLAAKREEQRRRNRAWNDREQSRQQVAARARMKGAAALPHPTPSPPVNSFGSAYPTQHTSISNEPSTGGLPGWLTGRETATVTARETAPPKPKALPVQSASAQATQLKPTKKFNTLKTNTLPQAPPKSAPKAVYQSTIDTSYRPPESRTPLSSSDACGLHLTGDDERTVSSFGSHRGLSVSSSSFVPATVPNLPSSKPIPPPGFMATPASPQFQPQPVESQMNDAHMNPYSVSSNDEPGFSNEQRQLGEIRATARAFVPTSFNPSMSDSGVMRPSSGAFLNSQAQSYPQLGSTTLEHNSIIGSHEVQSNFATTLLPPGAGGPNGFPFANKDSSITVSKERMTPMIPMSADSGTLTTSKSTISATEGPNLAGIPLGFGMEMMQPVGTSSLLTSISTNVQAGASSIWSGPQGVPTLGGLPTLTPMERNRREGDSHGTNVVGWGAGISTTLPPGGQGSIW